MEINKAIKLVYAHFKVFKSDSLLNENIFFLNNKPFRIFERDNNLVGKYINEDSEFVNSEIVTLFTQHFSDERYQRTISANPELNIFTKEFEMKIYNLFRQINGLDPKTEN